MKKSLLFILAVCSALYALPTITIPHTFAQFDTIRASHFNDNFDSLRIPLNIFFSDTLDAAFIRFDDLESGDTLLDSIRVTGGTITRLYVSDSAFIDTTRINVLGVSTSADFSGATISDLGIVTTIDINGGTIDGATIGANSSSTGAFTTLSSSSTTTIGDGTDDNVAVNARVTTDVDPDADNTYDLGGSSLEWKDVYIDGEAQTDTLTVSEYATFAGVTIADLGTVTTSDINGGTIDGVTIGGSSAGAGTFTTLETSGNVGIGVSAAARLHINNSTDELVRMESSSSTGSPYLSWFQNGTQRSYIRHQDTDDELRVVSEYGLIGLWPGSSGTETRRFAAYNDGTFDFIPGTQTYRLGNQGDALYFWGRSAGSGGELEVFNSDGDGTDRSRIRLFTQGLPSDITNRELLVVSIDGTDEASIYTEAGGSGDALSINIYTHGNSDQIHLATSGDVGIGKSPSFDLDVAGEINSDSLTTDGLTVGTNGTRVYESILIFKAADETVTSSTTLQNDNDFSFSIGANETYIIECHLTVSWGPGVGGFKYDFTGPTSPTNVMIFENVVGWGTGNASGSQITAFSSSHSFTDTDHAYGANFIIRGTIENGANAGTVQLRWAQETSDAIAATMWRGSYMKATQVE